MKSMFVAFALVSVATAALAQAGDGNDSRTTAEKQSGGGRVNSKGEPLICRMVRDADSGSLVRGRAERCLTAEQWRRVSRR